MPSYFSKQAASASNDPTKPVTVPKKGSLVGANKRSNSVTSTSEIETGNIDSRNRHVNDTEWDEPHRRELIRKLLVDHIWPYRNPDTVRKALGRLDALCNADEDENNDDRAAWNVKVILEYGGILAITEAMRKFPEDGYIHQSGCACLANIFDTNKNSVPLIVDVGGIPLILHTLRRFDEAVRTTGLVTLIVIASTAVGRVGIAKDKDWIPSLLDAMDKTRKNAEAQSYGCTLICEMASHEETRQALFHADAASAVARALRMHRHRESFGVDDAKDAIKTLLDLGS